MLGLPVFYCPPPKPRPLTRPAGWRMGQKRFVVGFGFQRPFRAAATVFCTPPAVVLDEVKNYGWAETETPPHSKRGLSTRKKPCIHVCRFEVRIRVYIFVALV